MANLFNLPVSRLGAGHYSVGPWDVKKIDHRLWEGYRTHNDGRSPDYSIVRGETFSDIKQQIARRSRT